jgi:aldehyde:ferredoxin oxidoreductase
MKGYVGSILRIDLTSGESTRIPLSETVARKYLGGTGLCARILWDELSPGIDPLSPSNILVIATGPINGTAFPPSGRYVIASKSPLTGIWGEAHAGGAFGAELKYAGYDALIIKGRAKHTVYIYIENNNVKINSGTHLWGLDTTKTTDQLIHELGDDPELKVACIGPAGENLVRYACIINDKYRAAGRCGLGAVMGSKNLKAIAVRGTGAVEVADFQKFMMLVDDARVRYTRGRWGDACQASLGTYGTTGLIEAENEIGRLPTRNHWSGVFKDFEAIGSRTIRKLYRKKRKSCFGCNIQCKYVSCVDAGKYAGSCSDGPEYETVMAFGSNCLNTDLASIIHANMLCNLFGLDTISTGKVISFMMECSSEPACHEFFGMYPDSKIAWADADKMIELIHKIAYRKGVGEILAEGTKLAAEKIGGGAQHFAIQVKGMELSGQDGRAHKSVGLTHAISVRGADHLRALSSLDELGYDDVVRERYPANDVNKILNLRTEACKGRLIVDMEDLYAIVDSLLICKYGTMWPPIFYFDDFANIIPATTGFDEYADIDYVRQVAKRICLLRRAFNAREGITRKDDTLPARLLREPMPEGPAKGEIVHLDPMLDEFYEFRGCDITTGMPTEDALSSVGLEDVAKALSKLT